MAKDQLYQGPIAVKKSAIQGYGVFALEDIEKGALVEECHTLLAKNAGGFLLNYAFQYIDTRASAFPLGYGCIYNHSDNPHVDYSFDKDNRILCFKAVRPIRAGEEIFTSYGDSWFSMRKTKPKRLSQVARPLKMLLRASLIILAGFAIIQAIQHLAA